MPTEPIPEKLQEFHQWFTKPEEIQSALEQKDGPNLVPIKTLQFLCKAQENQTKIGKHIIHLPDFMIRYVHVALAKLGIQNWAPHVNKQPDSLHNEAFPISALMSFQQLVVGRCYNFMNINRTYVNNFELLSQSYDHYVHYFLANIYFQEKKEQGKHLQDEERKVIAKSCQPLANSR